MEVYSDSIPINSRYVASIHNTKDNTITVLGVDNPDELSIFGVNDIRDYYIGVEYNVSDSDGIEYKIIRII